MNKKQTRLSRGEYSILSLVARDPLALNLLAAENLDELVNRRGHRLSPRDLVDTLHRLFGIGYLEIDSKRPAGSQELWTKQRIRALLKDRAKGFQGTRYRLTKTGGQVWEAFSQAAWHLFVREDGPDENGVGRLTCTDRRWLDVYLSSMSQLYPLSKQPIKYTIIRSWRATYWKTLHNAHRATFRYSSPDTRCSGPKVEGDADQQADTIRRTQLLMCGLFFEMNQWIDFFVPS